MPLSCERTGNIAFAGSIHRVSPVFLSVRVAMIAAMERKPTYLRMPLGEPSRVGYPGLSFLDPPMSGVAQPAFEASRSERRIGEEISDIGVKRALVLLQREKVISALVDDFLGDSLFASGSRRW